MPTETGGWSETPPQLSEVVETSTIIGRFQQPPSFVMEAIITQGSTQNPTDEDNSAAMLEIRPCAL